jgi:hypothetical protein
MMCYLYNRDDLYIFICYFLFWFHFIHTSCLIFKPSHSQDTMETLVAEPGVEGKESKTHTEAVAQVLASSKFLQNIGLVPATKKSSNGSDPTRVAELEAELESEKQTH